MRLRKNDLIRLDNRVFTVITELDYSNINVPFRMLPTTYKFTVTPITRTNVLNQNTGEYVETETEGDPFTASILPLSRDDLERVEKGFFTDVQKKLYLHDGRQLFVYYIGKEEIR